MEFFGAVCLCALLAVVIFCLVWVPMTILDLKDYCERLNHYDNERRSVERDLRQRVFDLEEQSKKLRKAFTCED